MTIDTKRPLPRFVGRNYPRFMKFILGWTFKLAFVGVLYLGFSSGFHVQLPETVMGYKVPESAQQFVDRTTKIADFGQQTEVGFKSMAAGLK